MGSQIIRQPNGLFACWSSVVDGFIFTDCTPDEIIEAEVDQYRITVADRIHKMCLALEAGERPHGTLHLDYETALAMHVERHGPL